MSFRDNLLKKIEIDKNATAVLNSIRPAGSVHKVDKNSMIYLLECAAYRYEKKRDLDLYHKEQDDGKKRIVVLDNDLSIYHTTIDDVVIRKSPYVKEMISIRNVIRILNDTDVVVSKKEVSVRAIQKESVDALDLSFDESDLEEIQKSGTDALAISDSEGVMEALLLFCEILGYVTPPKSFIVRGQTGFCRRIEMEDGTTLYGPIVLYNEADNEIKLLKEQISTIEKEKVNQLHKTAIGQATPDMEGADVFEFLKKEAMDTRR